MLQSSFINLAEDYSAWQLRIMARINRRYCLQTLHKSMNTTLVHMHQQRKNVQSTQQQSIIIIPSPEPSLEPLPVSTYHVYVNNFYTAGKIYTNLPGCFPILSNGGNRYLFILYY